MESSSLPQVSIDMDFCESLNIRPRSLILNGNDLKLIIEQVVDDYNFDANGYHRKEFFEAQGWMNYFNIVNGLTYSFVVRYFWLRGEVYDECSAYAEDKITIENDRSLKGKSRDEMGLNVFKGTKIGSVVNGVNITITW